MVYSAVMNEQGPAQPSAEEQERCVRETVALCRKLKSDGRLHSGFDFYIDDTGRITMRPLPPDPEFAAFYGEGQMVPLARKILGIYQEVRNNLSRDMDVSSDKWLSSPVGKALGEIERTMREEVYKMEEYVKKPDVSNVYNEVTFASMSSAIQELLELISKPGFSSMWNWRKMRALDAWAEGFESDNRTRAAIQSMSASAETIILLDDLRQRGRDVTKLIRSVATPKTLSALKTTFRER